MLADRASRPGVLSLLYSSEFRQRIVEAVEDERNLHRVRGAHELAQVGAEHRGQFVPVEAVSENAVALG